MSNKKSKLYYYPQRVKKWPGVWWYETQKGLEFQVENTAINPKHGQAHFVISWARIRTALKRKDKKQRG